MTGRSAVAVAGLLAGLGIVMAVWLSIDRRPPEWDHANHLERAVLCHRSLTEPTREALQEIIAESSFYPPIVTCAAGMLGFVLPPLAAAHAVMWAALVVGTLAVLGLGRRLLDPAAGLLAAFLFATAPFVVFSLMTFQLDCRSPPWWPSPSTCSRVARRSRSGGGPSASARSWGSAC
jgi:hypothetical protein